VETVTEEEEGEQSTSPATNQKFTGEPENLFNLDGTTEEEAEPTAEPTSEENLQKPTENDSAELL